MKSHARINQALDKSDSCHHGNTNLRGTGLFGEDFLAWKAERFDLVGLLDGHFAPRIEFNHLNSIPPVADGQFVGWF